MIAGARKADLNSTHDRISCYRLQGRKKWLKLLAAVCAAKFGILQMQNPPSSGCAHFTAVKQTGTAFSVLVGVPKSAMKTQGRLEDLPTTRATVVNQSSGTFVRNAGRRYFPMSRSFRGSLLLKRARSTIQLGSNPRCMSIATARNAGHTYPKTAKNSRKRLRSFTDHCRTEAPRRDEHGAALARSGQAR